MQKVLPRDTSATAQVLTFLVAGTVFVGALGTLLLATQQGGQDDRSSREAIQHQQAAGLAALVAGSPGIGWESGPDAVARLGLGAANGSGLQPSSLEALRGALLTASPNAKLDYAEARASLGLGGTQDFHLRIYPIGMLSVYKADSHLRTAYVGDWASLVSITLPLADGVTLQATAQARIDTTMLGHAATERLALRHLGLDFKDKVFVSALAPTILVDAPFPLPDLPLLQAVNLPLIEGDVYPDTKGYLDANLPTRLAGYELLVVGSGVDHNSLTSASVKYAIRDWVQAGGTLVVLGSDGANYQWLQPLFGAGVKTANGAPSAPDPSHPMLREPHVLDWTRYSDHGMGWDLKAQSAAGFSHVIVKGGVDVLAISDDGALGAGRVILTGYRPSAVAASLGQQEAERFLENIVLYTDQSQLYLEYGPAQPQDLPVAVAVRQSHLHDARLGQVPVRLEVHFWGSR